MADNMYVPQVDYTSRDYMSISDDMKSLIVNFAPQWTSRDPSDFGIVLVELFAYMGDLLNYYIDRAANESFISTATQRDTVLQLAQLLNYTPNDVSPATGAVTFTYQDTSGSLTIPAGTTVATTSDSAGYQVAFTTDAAVTINTSTTTGSVGITQGVKTSEIIGTSDGTIFQSFAISQPSVVTNGSDLVITVGSAVYQKVPFIIDYADDAVYATYTDGNGITYIEFGDGVSGKVPPAGAKITASYRYLDTPGSLGNVSAGTITDVVDTPDGTVINNATVTNAAATSGGADAESTDSIRINAPMSLRSLNRAVSLSDYAQLAIQVSGVAKAAAASAVFSNVTVYIAASGGTAASTTLKTNVSNYLSTRVPPNTSITVLDYTPVYPYITVTVSVLPQYDASLVKAAVLSQLYSLLSFDNVIFNDLITQGNILTACQSVTGVAAVTINNCEKLYVLSNSPTLAGTISDISCNLDEVPLFDTAYSYLTVNTSGGF